MLIIWLCSKNIAFFTDQLYSWTLSINCFMMASSVNKVYVPFVINNKQYVSIYLVVTYLSEMLP